MDRMEENANRKEWPLEALTGAILETAFDVSRELGHGFMEAVYRRAMKIALDSKGHRVEEERPFSISFRGHVIGEYRADLVVDDQVLLELKATKTLLPEHQAQTINYLKVSHLPIGLLINFGTPRIEYKRCHS